MKADLETIWYRSFVFATFAMMVPVRNAHYVVPIAYFAFWALGGHPTRLVKPLLFLTTFSAISAVVSLASTGANQVGWIWGFVTFAGFAVLFTPPDLSQIAITLEPRVRTFVTRLLLFQSSFGLIQFVYGGNPDMVAGTFDITSWIGASVPSLGQVYFTFNVIGMALFLAGGRVGPLERLALILATLVVAAAQSGHQTLMLVAAIAIVRLLLAKGWRPFVGAVVSISMILAVVFFITPGTLRVIPGWWDEAIVRADSPRRMSLDETWQIVQQEQTILVGQGVGQYSSRAGLLSSGEGTTFQLPSVILSRSELFETRVVPSLKQFDLLGQGSAINNPFSSVTTLLVEIGVFFSAVLLFLFLRELYRLRLVAKRSSRRIRRIAEVQLIGLVFLALVSFVENYLEFPQAILLPGLLAHLNRSSIRADRFDSEEPESDPESAPALEIYSDTRAKLSSRIAVDRSEEYWAR